MRVFGAIVLAQTSRAMTIDETQTLERCAIGSQSVGDDGLGLDVLILQQPPQELRGGSRVASLLHDHIHHLPDNPIHKDDPLHIEKVAGSMDQLDFLDPVLVGPNSEVIDGVARVKAAIRQGYTKIPVLVIDDVTPHQITAIRIALNKIQNGSRFDESVLKNGISDLIGQDFDVLRLGFDSAEIDALMASAQVANDQVLADGASESPPITRLNDIFAVGSHAIACGDCRRPRSSR